jgi:hypothetical protein
MSDSIAFVISFTNGDPELAYDTYDQAVAAIQAEFGSEVVIGHDGDLRGFGDRTLFWPSEDDAHDDDGARALGSIRQQERVS